jgi:hypothetical protein
MEQNSPLVEENIVDVEKKGQIQRLVVSTILVG